MVIRKMKRKDIPSVQDVANISWHATYSHILPLEVQDKFLASAYNTSMLKKRMRRSDIFVAEIDGKVVGFAQFMSPDRQGKAQLIALYLVPDYQGQGLGTALLNEGLKQLAPVSELYLHVERDNHQGRRFYQAKGFEVVDEFTEDFGGHTLNTIKMVLRR